MEVSITQIEQGINFWRAAEGIGGDAALGRTAGLLADIYGEMICARTMSVPENTLTDAQRAALVAAQAI